MSARRLIICTNPTPHPRVEVTKNLQCYNWKRKLFLWQVAEEYSTGACDGLSWIGMGWVEMGWVKLGWVGLKWVGLSWVKMGWVEMGWVERRWDGLSGDGLV